MSVIKKRLLLFHLKKFYRKIQEVVVSTWLSLLGKVLYWDWYTFHMSHFLKTHRSNIIV